MDPRIRVLVVDDNDSLRRLLEVVLGLEPGLLVVGAAWDAESAITLAASTEPQVIVLDNTMPGRTGLEVVGDLRAVCAAAVIVHSADLGPALRRAAAAAQVQVCLKGGDAQELVQAIRQAAQVPPGGLADADETLLERDDL